MNILGISCWYHDAAACLLQEGRITAAAQEERFTRIKHDASFPQNAIKWCLDHAGLEAGDLDVVAFYDKPFLKFERLLETYLTCAPRGLASFMKAMPIWLKRSLWIPDILRKELDFEGPLIFPEHHESHAASAFYPSPFERAAIITLDGVGEWATTSWGTGSGAEIRLLNEIHFPHSLGLFYSAVTYFCGFRVNSGEYKVMGLAPYGKPRYEQLMLDELIDLKDDGSFRLNMHYFSYPWRLTMTHGPFANLFDGPPRKPEAALTTREMDLARSAQAVIEEAVFRQARHVRHATMEKNLCLAGGVALNCVMNGRLHQWGLFEDMWIQPAAGDAGGALGAALMAWHGYAQAARTPAVPDGMRGALLGCGFTAEEIRLVLDAHQLDGEEMPLRVLVSRTAELLEQQCIVGWFQGRMEYGPRALGNRSILADPRSRKMQSHVNLRIKYRESFRPFAPAVRVEDVAAYFDHASPSPYMLMTAPVLNTRVGGQGLARLKAIESPVPAVTHVDRSARIQTVDALVNPLFHQLLTAFKARTGCPVLVNTSFNVRGEPIVRTPQEAVTCFLRTHMDVLVIGPYIVKKTTANATPLEQQEVQKLYGLD